MLVPFSFLALRLETQIGKNKSTEALCPLIGKFSKLPIREKYVAHDKIAMQFFARQIFTLLRDLKLEVQNINSREKV